MNEQRRRVPATLEQPDHLDHLAFELVGVVWMIERGRRPSDWVNVGKRRFGHQVHVVVPQQAVGNRSVTTGLADPW